jgi:hypothetical protein
MDGVEIPRFAWHNRLSNPVIHQLNRSNETPCLGRPKPSTTVPFLVLIHCGEVNNCSCPACSNSAYCTEVGFCGDPIFIYTT